MTAGSFQWPERLQMLCFRITFESLLRHTVQSLILACMDLLGTFQSLYSVCLLFTSIALHHVVMLHGPRHCMIFSIQ